MELAALEHQKQIPIDIIMEKLKSSIFLAVFSSPEPKIIGELLVYRGIRRPSSTFSNDFFSEAAGRFFSYFIYSIYR